MKRLALAAGILLAAAALAGIARPEGARAVEGAPTEDSVTVNGSGSASAVPNRAELSLGVASRGETARAALAANAREMRRVIDAVRAAGGQEISTQTVAVSAVYGENNAVTGYSASNLVRTTIDVGKSGALIDAAVSAGANEVFGPSLSSSEQSKLYRAALTAAVEDARLKARALAAASGRALGKVVEVRESSFSTPAATASIKAGAADESTPVVAGPQETTASVTVTFAFA